MNSPRMHSRSLWSSFFIEISDFEKFFIDFVDSKFFRVFFLLAFSKIFFYSLVQALSKISTFFEIRFKSDWIESRQNESIIRQTVIVHADMTVRMFLRHRIQGYVKLLIPYVSQHEVLGPLLAHMTSFCWRNFSLQISITNIDKTNRPTKSMLYCFSQPLFNLNRIVIGRLVRWYHVVSQYCTTNAEITQ